MKRSGRAWLLLPAVIAVLAAVGLLVSNYQKEIGLVEPTNAGRAAVGAAAVAIELSSGEGTVQYSAYSNALLAAVVAWRNMPIMNPADLRLEHRLAELVDCLLAAREAWQTEVDGTWNVETHGTSAYWSATHPSAGVTGQDLTASVVREVSVAQAQHILNEAAKLAD